MRKKIALVAVLFLLLLACAPANSNREIGGTREVPEAAKLDFPISELIERLVSKRSHYGSFPYLEGGERNSKNLIYAYNLPEVGSRIEVIFYTDERKLEDDPDWFVTIQDPKIQPFELFQKDSIQKICEDFFPWISYEVILGTLRGAIISDWSLHDKKGFYNPDDRAITIRQKESNRQTIKLSGRR